MGATRKRMIWGIGIGASVFIAIALVILVGAAWARGRNKSTSAREQVENGERELAIPVKATHPRKDPSLRITVRQLLSVKPFFEADMRSQVAGRVISVPVSIGSKVRPGDLLVEIDVPDLDGEVLQKTAVVMQRIKDVEAARAEYEQAKAQVVVAKELIPEREAERDEAIETREFRKTRSERFDEAAKEKAIQDNFADEERRSYKASIFAVAAARAAIRKAEADVKEKESSALAAKADIQLKESLVEVARKDVAVSEAKASYARITAPWRGEVVSCNVVEGAFVQNAATAQTEPMMHLVRSDIVTVVMKVPDNFAPYVSRNTDAVLELDDHPGVLIYGKVTRYSHSIQTTDRTMRVEVDLWNDTPELYNKFAARCVSTWLAPLAATSPLEMAPLLGAANKRWSKNCKDRSDPFPVLPTVTGTNGPAPQLLPGTSGYMRLQLQEFKDAYLLPSSAVFSRGGKPYVLEVVDGKSHLVPVRVQVDDGRLCKIATITQVADGVHGKTEEVRPLTGNETIILNRQVEIGDGQPVEVTLADR